MAPDEALELFSKILGKDRVEAERQAALDVIAACGYLPLSVRIAASRLVTRPMWTVAYLARRLSDERQKLDELQAGDLAVRAAFELSHAHLEPDHARAFRLLALPDSADFSVDMVGLCLCLGCRRAEKRGRGERARDNSRAEYSLHCSPDGIAVSHGASC